MFKADFWPLAAIDSVGQLNSRVQRSFERPEEQNVKHVVMSKQKMRKAALKNGKKESEYGYGMSMECHRVYFEALKKGTVRPKLKIKNKC